MKHPRFTIFRGKDGQYDLPFGYRLKIKKHWQGSLLMLCNQFKGELCRIDVQHEVYKRLTLREWAHLIIKAYNAKRKGKERIFIATGYWYS